MLPRAQLIGPRAEVSAGRPRGRSECSGDLGGRGGEGRPLLMLGAGAGDRNVLTPCRDYLGRGRQEGPAFSGPDDHRWAVTERW